MTSRRFAPREEVKIRGPKRYPHARAYGGKQNANHPAAIYQSWRTRSDDPGASYHWRKEGRMLVW